MDTTAPKHITEWFLKRTLSLDVLNDFGVRWDDRNKVIVIPVCDPNGKFLFNKYRRDPASDEGPKYSYDSGGFMTLFGADKIGDAKRVILCEGELDALCLRSHGFVAVSSTGGSGSFSPEWSELLKDREVIVLYDDDSAGAKGSIKVQSFIPWAKIAQLPSKSNVKDVTDFCIYLGGDAHEPLQKIFSEAKSYRTKKILITDEDTINRKKEVIKEYEELINAAREERAVLALKMRPTTFIDAYIEHIINLVMEVKRSLKPKKPPAGFTGGGRSIENAKRYPITHLIKFNSLGMAPCLWHQEKTASLHYIKHSNKVHCFGCDVTKDAIEVVMAQNNCSFADALNKLSP